MAAQEAQISIADIIRIRIELDTVELTEELTAAIKIFDSLILNFAQSLKPKDTFQ